jgi:hypothetical protein
LRELIAEHIGARIGATIMDTGHTQIRIAMAMERTSHTVDTRTSRGGHAEMAGHKRTNRLRVECPLCPRKRHWMRFS